MGVKNRLELFIVTRNEGKLIQFQRNAPYRSVIGSSRSLFDEDRIKKETNISPDRGFEYVAGISRRKLEDQRTQLLQTEGDGKDYAVIVSDSVVMLGNNGNSVAVDRDNLSDEQRREALAVINRDRRISFVGAVSFGRKNGQSVFTVLTYCDIPLRDSLDHYPIEIEAIPKLADKQRLYEFGYIRTGLNDDGSFQFTKVPSGRSDNFDDSLRICQARPYISGLTAPVLELVDSTAQFDRDTAPIVEELVEDHPFNTFSYYFEHKKDGRDLREFYSDLVRDRHNFFGKHGGNCTLHNRALVDELVARGYDVKMVVYPTYRPSLKNGHSGVIVGVGNAKFFFDPGISVPFAIPISQIPLFPIRAGDKEILAIVRNLNEDSVPDLVVLNKKGGGTPYFGQEVIRPAVFDGRMGDILTELHTARVLLKIDYHDRRGEKRVGISYDRTRSIVTVKGNDSIVVALPLSDFLGDNSSQQQLREICANCNVDPDFIMENLSAFANEN